MGDCSEGQCTISGSISLHQLASRRCCSPPRFDARQNGGLVSAQPKHDYSVPAAAKSDRPNLAALERPSVPLMLLLHRVRLRFKTFQNHSAEPTTLYNRRDPIKRTRSGRTAITSSCCQVAHSPRRLQAVAVTVGSVNSPKPPRIPIRSQDKLSARTAFGISMVC